MYFSVKMQKRTEFSCRALFERCFSVRGIRLCALRKSVRDSAVCAFPRTAGRGKKKSLRDSENLPVVQQQTDTH